MAGQGAAKDISILDFTWFGVGPIAMKYLADNGANVVKIESNARLDGMRLAPPWKNATPDVNSSQGFGSFNSSKKSITLDMNKPESRDIVKRLVPHFDIVAESFTPGNMAKWGLAYDDLRKLRPDIIALSTCMQGQTGPHSRYAGFGTRWRPCPASTTSPATPKRRSPRRTGPTPTSSFPAWPRSL